MPLEELWEGSEYCSGYPEAHPDHSSRVRSPPFGAGCISIKFSPGPPALRITLHILRSEHVFTFLNLVTEKINLFPSSYTSSCPVHSYYFQVRCIGGFCSQEKNNKHHDLSSASHANLL